MTTRPSTGRLVVTFRLPTSNPSNMISGLLSCVIEPPPRTKILISASGEPSTAVTCTPGSLPTMASAAEVVCTFSNILPDTLAIEPVRLPLFCVP